MQSKYNKHFKEVLTGSNPAERQSGDAWRAHAWSSAEAGPQEDALSVQMLGAESPKSSQAVNFKGVASTLCTLMRDVAGAELQWRRSLSTQLHLKGTGKNGTLTEWTWNRNLPAARG